MSATAARIDEYVSTFLSILCFIWLIYCFNYSYSLTRRVCLFRSSTVHYQHQQCQHVLSQHLCHHDALPSKATGTAAATTTRTQSDNGDTIVTRRQQHRSRTRTGNSPLSTTATLARPLSRSLAPWRPYLQDLEDLQVADVRSAPAAESNARMERQ